MRPIIRALSYLLVFSIPLENAVGLPGVGTLTRFLGLVLAVGWLGSTVATGAMRRPGRLHVIVLLLFAWNALSLLWTVDPVLSIDRIKTYGQLVGMTFIFWDLYGTRVQVERALTAYLLGAWGLTLAVIGSYWTGSEAEYQRYSGAGFNADDSGVILALGVPVAFHLLTRAGSARAGERVWTALCWAYVPAAFAAIGLTGTRTALLATIPGLLFGLSLLSGMGPRRAGLALGALLGGFVLIQPLIPQTSFERLGSIGEEVREGDLNGRTVIWSHGFDAFADRPVLGSGTGAFRVASGIDRVAHNSFLSVLVEVGVIGFSGFAVLLGLAGCAAMTHSRREARFWLALLLAWGVGAMALTWEHRKQTWLVMALVVTSAAVAREEKAPEPQPSRVG